MTIAVIASLAALLAYLAVRWTSARAENEELRLQVASLKRQLKLLGRSN